MDSSEAKAKVKGVVDKVFEVSKEAKLLASEIYYYLGHTQLLRSNDYLLENKNEDSNKKLIEAGADVLVAGNAVFAAENPTETIKQLKTI